MPAFNIASQKCPICKGMSVGRTKTWGFRSPSFKCPDCGADLKTAATVQMLWAVPVCAATVGAAYLITTWLHQSQDLGGAALAGVYGGLFGGAYAISAKVVLRGIAYRTWIP